MRYLILLLSFSLLCWGMALPDLPAEQLFMFWRHQGILLTGLIAIVVMGALMLMAIRPRWFEQRVGGLDHLYKLHKWCGIGAGVTVLLHWLLAKSPKWFVAAGWLELPPRQARAFDSWRWLAKEAGEWCFYAMLVFIVIGLLRAVPYRRFRQFHRLGVALFVMAAFHSIYFIPKDLRWMPFGILTVIACALGGIATIQSLLGLIGKARRSSGKINAIQQRPGGVLEIGIELEKSLRDYQPGQFVFLTLNKKEGAHPFTIVACDAERKQLRFAIKALGDYTSALPGILKLGDAVSMEGPYGGFSVHLASNSEYWLAGGIGITPFLAWLEALAATGERRPQTELYYCINTQEEGIFSERLQQLCTQTGVKLNLHVREQSGLLDPTCLNMDAGTQVWFCGPEGMREMLKKYIPASQLHFEHFEFR